MSKKIKNSFFFSLNQQRLITSLVIIACLLLVIGAINYRLDFEPSKYDNSSQESQENKDSLVLPSPTQTYSYFGTVNSLENNLLGISVDNLGGQQNYWFTLEDNTQILDQNQSAVDLTELQIGDNVYLTASEPNNANNRLSALNITLYN